MNVLKNKDKHKSHEHSPMKHMLHMILCCGIPMVIIFLLPFISSVSPAAAGILGVISPFICPIMMGGMIFMMFRKDKAGCCKEPESNSDTTLNK